jgi:hypothetical protein
MTSMPAFGTSLSHARIRELAVEAECDPRTVARVLLGETCKSLRAQRACERVLRKHNLLPAQKTATKRAAKPKRTAKKTANKVEPSQVEQDKPTGLAP